MGLLSRSSKRNPPSPDGDALRSDSFPDPEKYREFEDTPIRVFRLRILAMGVIVSMGGLIFGYDTGQISGFLAMRNFLERFHDEGNSGDSNSPDYWAFSNSREGTIVGLLSIGTLVGAIAAAPIANAFGRKICIVVGNVVFVVGVIIQIATETKWYQFAIGRLIAGVGVGGLSVLTPMYQSETAPRQIRGALISMYQLFITLGILLADVINLGTEGIDGPASWRITLGIGFVFPALMAVGILFLPESPRWDFRKGRIERARHTISLSYGTSETHREVEREMYDIRMKFEAETAGGVKHPWYEVFTGPRMAYRTVLGIVLQALQQLTGANFFFYYGTTVFQSVGLSNTYVTATILGAVNHGSTYLGLWVVEHFGRRSSLITGGLAMFVCFMIFASVGHFVLQPSLSSTDRNALGDQTAGNVMIVFACLFIFSYAVTWGPIIWTLTAELYPTRYRAQSMGFATASNWLWNFLIAFFTPYITAEIDFRYGYVFASCCFAGAVIVYFFVCESSGRTLEEIDTMYIMHVTPWKSKTWKAPLGEGLGETDNAYLTAGGRGIRKPGADTPVAGHEQVENSTT